MPTPRKRQRVNQLNLRLTDAEEAALSARARAVQQPFSVYARERLLHGINTGETRRVMSAESAALIRMLTRVGERLNFLLAMSREHPTIHEDIAACHKVVCETIMELSQE